MVEQTSASLLTTRNLVWFVEHNLLFKRKKSVYHFWLEKLKSDLKNITYS